MVNRTIRYLWGKKFMIIIILLVIILLPNIIGRELQVRTTAIITEMEIDNQTEDLTITAQKLKSEPGAKGLEFETVVYHGHDLQTMLQEVSLAHCTSIKFTGDPDINLLKQLYGYQDLRANTKVNETQTIDEILKNHYYHCQ